MNNDYALPGLRTAYQDGSVDITPLLKEVSDAHGGLTQWKQCIESGQPTQRFDDV